MIEKATNKVWDNSWFKVIPTTQDKPRPISKIQESQSFNLQNSCTTLHRRLTTRKIQRWTYSKLKKKPVLMKSNTINNVKKKNKYRLNL